MKHTVHIRSDGSGWILECTGCSLAGIFMRESRAIELKDSHRDTGAMMLLPESLFRVPTQAALF